MLYAVSRSALSKSLGKTISERDNDRVACSSFHPCGNCQSNHGRVMRVDRDGEAALSRFQPRYDQKNWLGAGILFARRDLGHLLDINIAWSQHWEGVVMPLAKVVSLLWLYPQQIEHFLETFYPTEKSCKAPL